MGRKCRDITGQRFGILTAIENTGRKYCGVSVWRCHCDCGRDVELPIDRLTKGVNKSCGCQQYAYLDLTGQRYGRLTVLGLAGQDKFGQYQWRCRCDCGKETVVGRGSLRSGNAQSCGCLNREKILSDVTGQQFGELTAISRTDRKYRGTYYWKCRCSCGRECEVLVNNLRAGRTRSCGCMNGTKLWAHRDAATATAERAT